MPLLEMVMEHETQQDSIREFDDLEIGSITKAECDEALAVLVRGMRDNPIHIQVFGEQHAAMERGLGTLFGAGFDMLNWHEHVVVARDASGAIVAVCGMNPPGAGQPTASQQMRLLPRLLTTGPGTMLRTLKWLKAWADQTPAEPAWRFGPLAVDSHLQGKGIGTQIMHHFCARMDAAGDTAFLETDKAINVTFYRKFGFEIVSEATVLGIPNWFMIRRPAAGN